MKFFKRKTKIVPTKVYIQNDTYYHTIGPGEYITVVYDTKDDVLHYEFDKNLYTESEAVELASIMFNQRGA